MAYFLSAESNETFSYPYRALDGDMDQVVPADLSRDAGTRVRSGCAYSGRAVLPDHVPTIIELDGPPRDLPSVYGAFGLMVDEFFRGAVEKLEPHVHQFFPMEMRWKDGSRGAHRFWFVPCQRIDSVDRAETTFAFRGLWDILGGPDKTLVFNRAQIDGRHVWIDMFIHVPTPIISDTLKAELDKAGITGAHYRHCREV